MPELAFRDGVMDRIRLREPRFHEHAYLFVLSATSSSSARPAFPSAGTSRAEARRGVPRSRAAALRCAGKDGAQAFQGIRSTADFGHVVFTLEMDLEAGLAQPGERHARRFRRRVRLRGRVRPAMLTGTTTPATASAARPPGVRRGRRSRRERIVDRQGSTAPRCCKASRRVHSCTAAGARRLGILRRALSARVIARRGGVRGAGQQRRRRVGGGRQKQNRPVA